MIRSFNPITKTVSSTRPQSSVQSLQQICRNAILHAVTLNRINKYQELPLPTALSRKISLLNLQDFIIDVEKIGPNDHVKQTYPATCVFDNKDVVIKVLSKGSHPDLNANNPSFIIAFEEDQIVCCIYEKTGSLADHIQASKAKGSPFQESFIWKTVNKLAQEFKSGRVDPVAKISTSVIRFHSSGKMFLEFPSSSEETGHMSEVGGGIEAAVYEAPEVLGRQDVTEKAFSWTIGCVIYEMLALEPAFYDRSGVNPFSVFMDIMQGTLPPEPTEGSPELKNMMHQCLKPNPDDRISLDDLLRISQQQTKGN